MVILEYLLFQPYFEDLLGLTGLLFLIHLLANKQIYIEVGFELLRLPRRTGKVVLLA